MCKDFPNYEGADCLTAQSPVSSRKIFRQLHHFVALAQERRNIEIVLLEVRHHRAAHAVERNHVGST